MSHDQLCPMDRDMPIALSCLWCTLITQVRADERRETRTMVADEFIELLFSAPMSRLVDDDGTQYVSRDEAINLARRVGRGA